MLQIVKSILVQITSHLTLLRIVILVGTNKISV
jgi:hypothetical protein